MKRLIAVLLAVLLLLSAAGCSSEASGIGSDIAPRPVSASDLGDDFKSGIHDFTAELFKRCADDTGNIIISPFSVLMALSMAENGAEGETLAQFEQLTGLDRNTVNGMLHTYMESINSKTESKVRLADSIWLNENKVSMIKDSFLQNNADYYGADVFVEQFDTAACNKVNGWISKKTDKMIENMLSQLDSETVMLLINAIVFDAEWAEPYDNYQVSDDTFHAADGSEQTVPFMCSTEGIYLEDEHATGVMKSYRHGEYAFVALLPEEGMTAGEYAKTLTGEKLKNIIADRSNEYDVVTKLPKFKSDFGITLNDTLKDMGLTCAFEKDGSADFSGISDTPLFISAVIHKGYIEVDEKGTKAGAATVIMMDEAMAMFEEVETKYVFLDRPFVYAIYDMNAGVPLFIGIQNKIA